MRSEMVQGNRKMGSGRPGLHAAKHQSAGRIKVNQQKAKMAKVGAPVAAPKKKTHYNLDYLEERELSKAIDKANEQKIAAKTIQDGGHLAISDLKRKGKELNREQRRTQVKKKLTRVEEKLVALKAKAEREGMTDAVE